MGEKTVREFLFPINLDFSSPDDREPEEFVEYIFRHAKRIRTCRDSLLLIVPTMESFCKISDTLTEGSWLVHTRFYTILEFFQWNASDDLGVLQWLRKLNGKYFKEPETRRLFFAIGSCRIHWHEPSSIAHAVIVTSLIFQSLYLCFAALRLVVVISSPLWPLGKRRFLGARCHASPCTEETTDRVPDGVASLKIASTSFTRSTSFPSDVAVTATTRKLLV